MNATDIVSVEADPIDIELTEPFAIAGGAPTVAANVLVRITLADGTIGMGEAAPFEAVSGETQRSSLAAIEAVREWLIDQDVRRYRPMSDRLAADLPGEPAARCAIEVALVDALARHHELPLWAFFGGAGTELHTDMTITAGDREQAVAAAHAIVARGISAIKVKIGTRSAEDDAEKLEAVHHAAPHAKLTVDANGGYSPRAANLFLDRVRAMNVPLDLFEQPVGPQDWLEFMRTKPKSNVVICADESARSAVDVLALIRDGAIEAINIKPMKTGVVESIAIWNLARAAGLGLMIGGMIESPLAMSFSAHLAAGLGGFSYVDLDTPMFMKEHPFSGGFEQRGSLLSVAHVEAGHGVSLEKKDARVKKLSLGAPLLTPIAMGYFEALDVTASIVIKAKAPAWFPVYRARRGFDPLQFERRYDQNRTRSSYNKRMLRRAEDARAPLIGDHNGFCDLFVPVYDRDRCVAWLVAGPFARTPPTLPLLSRGYQRIAGKPANFSDAEFGAFVRVVLDTVTLDEVGLRELEMFAQAFSRVAAGTSRSGDLENLTDLRERALKRHQRALMWQTAVGLVDRFESPLWRSRSIRGSNLVVLGVSRLPTDVVCALPERRELPEAKRALYLLRARSFQEQCTRWSAEQADLLCGPLGDDGVFVLARTEHRITTTKRRATLNALMRNLQTLARGTLDAPLRFGVSRHVTSPALLPAAHSEALFALDWAMHRREGCVFFEEEDRPTGAGLDLVLRGLCEAVESGDLGRVTIANEHWTREVLWRAGGNPELGRGHFEIGVGELVRHLERRAILEGKALRVVERGFRLELAEASLLSQLASAFERRVKSLAEGVPRPALAERGARLDRALDLVRRNLASDVSRTKVAKECGMSPSYFSRLFATRHGVGYERFVIQARIDEAKRLLRSTDHPVHRVAVACGFSSYAHLAKAFRRETGSTPRTFRQSYDT